MAIKNFTELRAWKEAYKLVKVIYVCTGSFPKEESYALTSQMRRSVVSVTSNIAEGFARRTRKEKMQFYYMAHGSLTELQSQLIVAYGVGYIDKTKLETIQEQIVSVQKLTNGLIKGTIKIRDS
jgi:S23 ribosomal protein.